MGQLAFCVVISTVLAQLCLCQKVAPGQGNQVLGPILTVSVDKRPTKVVGPVYPDIAKRAGIKGSVVVDIVIGKTGEVESAQAIAGPKDLWSAATEAVKQWKWEPFLLNEKPIRVRTKVVVKFVLKTRDSSDKKKSEANGGDRLQRFVVPLARACSA